MGNFLTFLDNHAEEMLGAVLLAIMTAIAFVNVIVRYGTTFSFAWTEELTINLFVWVVLLGTASTFRHGEHLGMGLIYKKLPPPLRLGCFWFSLALGWIFFGALCWYGVLEVMDEYELESISESLGIPVWWYTLATPLFSLLTIFRMTQRAFMDMRQGTY